MACLIFDAAVALLSQSGLQAVHLLCLMIQALGDMHAAELRLTEAAYCQGVASGKTLSIVQGRKSLAAARRGAYMSSPAAYL